MACKQTEKLIVNIAEGFFLGKERIDGYDADNMLLYLKRNAHERLCKDQDSAPYVSPVFSAK